MAWRNGYSNALVESDSVQLVQMVTTQIMPFHPYATVLKECRDLLLRQSRCRLRHVYREANSAAHGLAMMGQYHTRGLQIFNVVPACISTIIMHECTEQ